MSTAGFSGHWKSRIHAAQNRALLLHHMPGYPPTGKTAVAFHHLKSFFDVPTAVCIQLRLRQPTCLCVLHSPGCPWSGISHLRVHDHSHPCVEQEVSSSGAHLAPCWRVGPRAPPPVLAQGLLRSWCWSSTEGLKQVCVIVTSAAGWAAHIREVQTGIHCLSVLEAGGSRSGASTGGSGVLLLPFAAALAVLRWQGGQEAGRRLCPLPVLVRTLISSQGLHPPSWPYLNLVSSQGPTSKCSHVGLGFSACMWVGGELAQYNPQHSLFCSLILS